MTWDEHVKNRNEYPPEELAKYYGKQVAWSLDGRRIVASGNDDLQVYQAAEAAGFDPEQVVVSYVPFPDEIMLGGGMVLDEETGE